MYFATGISDKVAALSALLIGIGAIAQFIVSIKNVRLRAKNNSSKAFLWIGVSLLYLAVLAWAIAVIFIILPS
jgi:hypothetical protein